MTDETPEGDSNGVEEPSVSPEGEAGDESEAGDEPGPETETKAETEIEAKDDDEFDAEERETLAALGITVDDATAQAEWTFPSTKQTGDSAEYGSGVAVWDDLPTGKYEIDVTHPDYNPGGIASLTLDSSGRQPVIHLAPAERPRHSITITVEGPNGTPLRDVTVVLGETRGQTGTNGDVTLQLPEGTHALALEKQGYQSRTDNITVDGAAQYAYTLFKSERPDYIYDPTDPPYRRFGAAYYPFDADSGYGDIIGRFADIEGVPTSGVNAYADGLLGTPGVGFGTRSENEYLTIPNVPLNDPSAPFTLVIWARRTGTGAWQGILTLGDPATGEHLGIGLDTDDTLRAFSASQTSAAKSGTKVPAETWVQIALVWDGYRIRGYLNETEAFAATPDQDPHEWLGGASRLTVGSRRLGTTSPYGGDVDELSVFDTALSGAQIAALYRLSETANVPGLRDPGRTGAAIDLITDVDLPARRNLRIRVEEDVGNTGTVDNVDTVTVRDGIRRTPLDALQGGEGNHYQPHILSDPEPLDAEESSVVDFAAEFSEYINDIALETSGSSDRVYTVAFRGVLGDTYHAPAYPPDTISEDWLRVRPSSGDPVGAFRLTDPTGAILRVRHPRTGTVRGVALQKDADLEIDVAAGTVVTVGVGETLSVASSYDVAGSVDNSGRVDNQ